MPILDRRPVKEESGADEESKDLDEESSEEETSPEEVSTSNDATDEEDTEESSDEEVEETTEEVEEPEEAASGTDSTKEKDGEDDSDTAVQAIRAQKQKLLDDIKLLRDERRTLRDQPTQPLVVPAREVSNDDLKDLAPADVELLERFVRSKGFMTREELSRSEYDRSVKSHQDAWLDEHPEYKPENDPNDEKWLALKSIVSDLYKAPSDPRKIKNILDSAHRELNPNSTPNLPKKSRAEADAANKKLKVSSKTGGSGGTKTAPSKKRGVDLSHLKGFTAEELEELSSS